MYKNQLVGVVIPAHNEESFVGEVIETVPEFVDRIYAVDDCSTDGTWAAIQRASSVVNGRDTAKRSVVETEPDADLVVRTDGGSFDKRAVTIRHERNTGVGGAIKTGYRRAIDDGLDVVAVMNGDGQMDPDILDRIIQPVVDGEADYAKGDRLRSSDNWRGMSGFRLLGNYLLTHLTRIATGYWRMSDPQNGYTAISVDALQELDLDDLYDEYGFLNDLLVNLNLHDMRVVDVEMQAVYGEERSGIRYRRFIPRLSVLLLRRFLQRLKVRYLDGGHPLAVPYLAGVVLGLVGLAYSTVETARGASGPASVAAAVVYCGLLLLVGLAADRYHSTVDPHLQKR